LNFGRQAGKSTLVLNQLLKDALLKPNSRYWIIAPTYRQVKNIYWKDHVKTYVIPELIKKMNETELSIELINGSLLEFKGADNPDCYDNKTEILTDEGWKLFENLNGSERVLTLNKQLIAEWQKPIRYIREDYTGEMCVIKNKKLDLVVTPNHKFFIQSGRKVYKIKSIQDIAWNDRIPAQVRWKPSVFNISNDEMAFMGIYLSEGSAYGCMGGDINKRKGGYSVFISQINKEKRNEIKELLIRMGYKVGERKHGFEILNKALWKKLLPLGNKYTKFIPRKYKEVSAEKLRILLDWLIKGDGTIHNGSRYYYTTSKRLADDVQEIAVKAGYSANISIKPQAVSYIRGREINSKHILYQVAIYKNKFNYFRNATSGSYITKRWYNGKIYCVEVPNHVVLVRRNGKICWSGNSLRGPKLDGCALDEYAFIKPYIYEKIISPMTNVTRGRVIFVSTPNGYNHFKDLADFAQKKENQKNWGYYHATSYDNPYIDREELEYKRKTLPEDVFAQEYLAEFCKKAGLVYKEFDRSTHVIKLLQPKEEWVKYVSIDPGQTNPTAVLFIGVDQDNNLFIYDEIYRENLKTSELANLIKAKQGNWFITAYIIDSAAKETANNLSEYGIYTIPSVKIAGASTEDHFRAGIERVRELLKIRENGQPKLFVASHCQNTIREFETYSWKDISEEKENLNKPERPEKAFDHCMDALRYFVQTIFLEKTEDIYDYQPKYDKYGLY